MLLSMTGFGDARRQFGTSSLTVEIRAVNNRFLKVSTKLPEAYASLEAPIEKVIRETVGRGTLTVVVRSEPNDKAARYAIRREVLEHYWRQLNQLAEAIHLATPKDLSSLLQLPGVVVEDESAEVDLETNGPLLLETVREALAKLGQFRRSEGESMEQELRRQCTVVADRLSQVDERAGQVVSDFRDRLLVRVRELLAEFDVSLDASDLLREVTVFAERCDIHEEITRLRSHLDQFTAVLSEPVSQGRKLEFLSQEMFREVNTIGSKANDVSIAHAVVDMKAAIERVREMLQNVE